MSELEERRREKKPDFCVGDATGAGGGEGSRRPKRGMFLCSRNEVDYLEYEAAESGRMISTRVEVAV